MSLAGRILWQDDPCSNMQKTVRHKLIPLFRHFKSDRWPLCFDISSDRFWFYIIDEPKKRMETFEICLGLSLSDYIFPLQMVITNFILKIYRERKSIKKRENKIYQYVNRSTRRSTYFLFGEMPLYGNTV